MIDLLSTRRRSALAHPFGTDQTSERALAHAPLATDLSRRNRIMESLESRILFSFNPTGLEQEALELMNRMQMNPAAELNQIFISTQQGNPNYFRSQDADVNAAFSFFNVNPTVLLNQWGSLTPAAPLAWNSALTDAARAHSQRMIQQDLQSHQLPADLNLNLPAEASLLNRAVAAGYNWTGSVSVGENVFAYAESVFHAHAAFAIDWGTTSTGIQSPPGHRENIMDSNFREIGIGILADSNPATSVGPLVMTQDFGTRGNYGQARVLGVIFNDANGNAFYNAGEGLGDVNIRLENGGIVYNTTTFTAGGYQIEVAPGSYSVVASGGSLQGPISMGTITVGNDNVKLDLNLATLPTTGTVAGVVFADADEDGLQETGELGLAGWTVFVDANRNGVLDTSERSLVTTSSGDYEFNELAPGSWSIRVQAQNAFRGTSPHGLARDVTVTAGSQASDIDFGLFRWVVESGTSATVFGRAADDVLQWSRAQPGIVTLNGQVATLSPQVTLLVFQGGSGVDTATLTGSAADDTATSNLNDVLLSGQGFSFRARDTERVTLHGGGGNDVAYMSDSPADDVFTATPTSTTMEGPGGTFRHVVNGFRAAYGYSNNGGRDVAYLGDGPTDDRLTANSISAILEAVNGSFYLRANRFSSTYAYARGGGFDEASLYDTGGNDEFIAYEKHAFLRNVSGGYLNVTRDFERVYAFATLGGNDVATFSDSAANDIYTANPTMAEMTNGAGSYLNRATGFKSTIASATTGGQDTARLSDGAGDDMFVGRVEFAEMYSVNRSYSHRVNQFERVFGTASAGGYNEAYLYDRLGDDVLIAAPTNVHLRGAQFEYMNQAEGFQKVRSYADRGGFDSAYFYDGAGNEVYTGTLEFAWMQGPNNSFYNLGRGFDKYFAYGTGGGNDMAFVSDTAGDDTFTATQAYAEFKANNGSMYHRVNAFDSVYAYSTAGGNDVAYLSDGAGNDVFVAHRDYAYLAGANASFLNHARGFRSVYAYATGGGNDTASLYDSSGDDTFFGRSNYGILQGTNFYNRANSFDTIQIYGQNGGTNQIDVQAIDYVLQQFGVWI